MDEGPGMQDEREQAAAGQVEPRLVLMLQVAAIAVLLVACFQVLRFFIPAFIFAVVVAISAWPLHERVCRAVGGRSWLAALLMVTLLILLVAGPTALLAVSVADGVTNVIEGLRGMAARGPMEPPAWLRDMPLVGSQLEAYWRDLAGGGEAAADLVTRLLEPARAVVIGLGRAFGQSLVQFLFAAFIGFFIFRDGEQLAEILRRVLARVAGRLGDDLLATVRDTVAGVVQGVFGAALAQATIALIGFLIAGVPGAFLLGAATLFLSPIPLGPPLLWGGACVWLFDQGAYGRAIFLGLWGLLLVSSIDNVVRPYLISRGARLSVLLIVLGVFGGVAAFGFIGIFIGPPILALARSLIRLWTSRHPDGASVVEPLS